MSDAHRDRSSKRKGRDGSAEVQPRKKQHRQNTASSDDSQSDEYDSDGERVPTKHVKSSKIKPAIKKEKEYPSVNELKNRIRGVKRLLSKDLPADARIVQERALAGYEQDLAEELARRERSSMIKKYHFVRFLDRKTATKQLKRLERREQASDLSTEQKAELSQKIHAARVNLNYTIYYPLTEKYISLYPKSHSNSGENDEKAESHAESKDRSHTAEASQPPMWPIIEKCMKEGNLDDLREGKLNIGPDGQQKPATARQPTVRESDKKAKQDKAKKQSKEAPKKEKLAPESASERLNRRERRKELQKARELAAQQAADGDSDGGFFEM